jgi:hypothetical protein
MANEREQTALTRMAIIKAYYRIRKKIDNGFCNITIGSNGFKPDFLNIITRKQLYVLIKEESGNLFTVKTIANHLERYLIDKQ